MARLHPEDVLRDPASMATVKPPMRQDAPEREAVSTPREVRAETTMAEKAPLEGVGERKRRRWKGWERGTSVQPG